MEEGVAGTEGVQEPRSAPERVKGRGEPPEALYARGTARGPDRKPRCERCGRVLAWFVSRPWRVRCPRCGLDNAAS